MKKTRPAVVVQNDVGNENSGTPIVAPTTGSRRGSPFEVPVEAADSPLETDSSVRLDQIRVISVERRIHSVVGPLDRSTTLEVDEAVKPSLALDRRTEQDPVWTVRTARWERYLNL